MSRNLSIPLAALSMCLLGFVARAQDRPSQPATLQSTAGPSGTFAGRLNGAGTDGATVTLTNTATGESQTAVTGSDG